MLQLRILFLFWSSLLTKQKLATNASGCLSHAVWRTGASSKMKVYVSAAALHTTDDLFSVSEKKPMRNPAEAGIRIDFLEVHYFK